ncbi:hypothetical protein, partial [Pseudomonas lundensis]|uniref:hypothetical protein n=1 Tax=Pseudomonas lundensis TaxID=86185 RepID=UPI0006424185
EIGKAHLAHRRLGSGGQAYFSTFENLFGDSLYKKKPHQRLIGRAPEIPDLRDLLSFDILIDDFAYFSTHIASRERTYSNYSDCAA